MVGSATERAPLFSSHIRLDMDVAKFVEPTFDYLDRSGRRSAAALREVIESWRLKYPLSELAELDARLRTQDNFPSAFFELYLHEVFTRLGMRPRVHPTIPGRQTRPDFRLQTGEGSPVIVEAVTLTEGGRVFQRSQRFLYEALDALNSISTRNYSLHVEPEGRAESPLPLSRLRGQVEEFLRGLDHSRLLEAFTQDDSEDFPSTFFQHDGLFLKIEAMPVIEDLSNDSTRVPVGGFGPVESWVESGQRLRSVIRKKARDYGELGLPYVIAVSFPGYDLAPSTLLNVLIGTFEYVMHQNTPGGPHRLESRRRRDGVWRGGKGSRYTRVSAVLVAERLTPWSMVACQPILVHNPWAKYPILDIGPELTHYRPIEGKYVERSGLSAIELLQLSPELPGLIRDS